MAPRLPKTPHRMATIEVRASARAGVAAGEDEVVDARGAQRRFRPRPACPPDRPRGAGSPRARRRSLPAHSRRPRRRRKGRPAPRRSRRTPDRRLCGVAASPSRAPRPRPPRSSSRAKPRGGRCAAVGAESRRERPWPRALARQRRVGGVAKRLERFGEPHTAPAAPPRLARICERRRGRGASLDRGSARSGWR